MSFVNSGSISNGGEHDPTRRDVALAESIIHSLWKTYDRRKEGELLHLDAHFYHKPSGLHSEGVWHNCIMGVNYVKLFEITRDPQYKDSYLRLAHSLFDLNSNPECGGLFRSRSLSPYWSHSDVHAHTPLGDNYSRLMKPDHDVRVISNAIAIVFWSFIRDDSAECSKQYQQLVSQFIKYFWDEKDTAWRTSLSNTKSHKRAVDQAMVLIALVRMLRVYDESKGDGALFASKDHILHLIQMTRDTLLNRFGFSDPKTARSYIRNNSTVEDGGRFLWQDIWVLIALLLSRPSESETLRLLPHLDDQLLLSVHETYHNIDNSNNMGETTVGLMYYNEPRAKGRTSWGSPLCCFTGDNSMFYMLLRFRQELLQQQQQQQQQREEEGEAWAQMEAFRQVHFHRNLQKITVEDGLLLERGGTAPKNTHATLWACSETCAALLWSASDFVATYNNNNNNKNSTQCE